MKKTMVFVVVALSMLFAFANPSIAGLFGPKKISKKVQERITETVAVEAVKAYINCNMSHFVHSGYNVLYGGIGNSETRITLYKFQEKAFPYAKENGKEFWPIEIAFEGKAVHTSRVGFREPFVLKIGLRYDAYGDIVAEVVQAVKPNKVYFQPGDSMTFTRDGKIK